MKKIAAIILAAGKSRRFGTMKQFVQLNEKPLFMYPLERAIKMALHPIVLVGNPNTAKMKDHITSLNVNYTENDHYELGLSSSIIHGLDTIKENIDAVIILLADQPFITLEVIKKMIDTYHSEYDQGIRIVRPYYEGKAGHPVLFDQSFFQQLRTIRGDQGGKNIIESNINKLKTIKIFQKELNMDIDTLKDLEKAQFCMKHSLLFHDGPISRKEE